METVEGANLWGRESATLPMTSSSISEAPAKAGLATIDCSEDMRAAVLASHGLDSLQDDPELAAIVKFATKLCDAPLALVTVVEADRQLFLATEGTEERETPRSTSFCAHAMLGTEPMVVPDASKDPRFADFALVTGPENIRFYAGAPLLAKDGTPIGALCVIDTVPRPEGLNAFQREGLETLAQSVVCRMHHNRQMKQAEGELEFSEARLRTVMDSMPHIAWSSDAEGRFDYFNARWTEVTGAAEPVYTNDWEPHIHPDDYSAALSLWKKSFAEREPFDAQYRLKQRDGSYRWILARAAPIITGSNTATRWSGTVTDVDEAHRHSESRELLALELSHRIKNIFAVISGLISLTSRSRPEAADFAQELNSKIRSLGRAHDFVRPINNDKGNSLHGLLEVLMKAYADADKDRVTVEGDGIMIGVKSATPLALVFHEFATNSAKYGALSVPEGKVAVSLTRGTRSDSDEECAIIEWQESGGPVLAPDAPEQADRTGFGTRLVEMTVTGQLRGQLLREMRAEGFTARLTIPLSAL